MIYFFCTVSTEDATKDKMQKRNKTKKVDANYNIMAPKAIIIIRFDKIK